MASTDDGSRKSTLSLGVRRQVERTTTETGASVQQRFSRGRLNNVAVVVKKRRTVRVGRQDGEAQAAEKPAARELPAAPAAPETAKEGEAAAPALKHLSQEERKSRFRALEQAQKADEEVRRRAGEEARFREEEEARLTAEREAAERRAKEEAERLEREEEARRRAEEQAKRLLDKKRETAGNDTEGGAALAPGEVAEDEDVKRGKRDVKRSPLTPGKRTGGRRRSGKLTVAQALNEENREERARSLAAARRAREKLRQQQLGRQAARGPAKKMVREVVVPEAILVSELANRMAVRGSEIVKKMMEQGVMVTVNQTIDADTAEVVVAEFGHRVRRVSAADIEVGLKQDDDPEDLKTSRAPVVTVMGHVDHGKTSLLDALRRTDVVSGEAGGITQHIGAYQVRLGKGERITFLDTPGHEAFTSMRARGAGVTDIVVLVVAADDSVMPQTREAIRHAEAAGVPMIVAINKCDLPGADPDRVRQDLLRSSIVVESLAGDVQDVEISAVRGDGLDRLEEAILLQAEVLELKANPDRGAEGVVVEAKLDKGRGAVSTVLVQRGTLRVGDTVVVGSEWGRVRALMDDRGQATRSAGPAIPVEVLGLSGAPLAGDEFYVVENEKRAREIAAYRVEQERQKKIASTGHRALDQLLDDIRAGKASELPVVIKADVQGSAEAIADSITALGTEEVKPRILLSAVGGITESDVTLARASGAVIFGFNVRANSQARQFAAREGVDLVYYRVIYELLDRVRDMLSGLLKPTTEENVLGAAQVLETFDISGAGRIAGCRVMDGIIRAGARVRLLRDGRTMFDGAIRSLRHHKDQVREIRQGSECGIQPSTTRTSRSATRSRPMSSRRSPGPLKPERNSQRRLRVGEEIRHVLSEMFARGDVHDAAVFGRAITVSEVRMSPDLRHATCFVMTLGGDHLAPVMEGLARAAPWLRGEVARRVRLRVAPELAFRADRGFDHARRIGALLDRVADER